MFNTRSKAIDENKGTGDDTDRAVVLKECGDNNQDIIFMIRKGHMEEDLADTIQIAMLQGYIECGADYGLEIDVDIYKAYDILLQKLLANSKE